MATYRFILSEDTISPGGWAQFVTGGANRMLFCIQGSVGLGDLGTLGTHEAICTRGNTNINTGHDGALLWRWELFHNDEEIEDEVAGLTSRIIGEAEIELDELTEYVFRCESLGLPPEDEISEHLVLGPTFSAILEGNITLNREGHLRHMSAADAWFDDGTSPIKFSVEDEDPAIIMQGQLLAAPLLGQEGTRFVATDKLENAQLNRYHKINIDEIILV